MGHQEIRDAQQRYDTMLMPYQFNFHTQQMHHILAKSLLWLVYSRGLQLVYEITRFA